jgi:LEA14-like dessication related protein
MVGVPPLGALSSGALSSGTLSLGALSLSVLAGCATPQPPTVTPQVARVVQVDQKGLELQVTLSVQNPNEFALSAHEVQGTLFAEGKKLGTGKSNPEQSIPARGVGSVESRVQIAWGDVPALQMFLLHAEVPYEFKGDVTLGGDTLQLTLPFEMKGTLTREQLLRAGLRGL